MRQVFVLSIRFLVTRRLLGLVAHLTVCDGVSVCASAIVQDIRCFVYRNLTLETSSPSSQFCSSALCYCACCPKVTVTSTHPPRLCRLAVFFLKPDLLPCWRRRPLQPFNFAFSLLPVAAALFGFLL